MKLIYVCRNSTLLGGQSRIAWELARRAMDKSHEVHLVARRLPQGVSETSIHVHRVFQLPSFVGEWWRFRSFATLSSKCADKLAGDNGVIHGFGDNYASHIITLGNVDWNYAKHIPGREPDRTAVYVKKRAFLNPRLQFLVLVSHQMRRDLLDLLPGFDQSKIKIIYPGVDLERFQKHTRESIRSRLSKELGIPADAFWIVLAAGGDFEKRNISTLANALLRLRQRPEWRLLLVGARHGSLPLPRELETRSHFLGRLDDIGTVLPGCDLLAYPAWYDESPLVCLESMASGLPLVVSKKVGTSEVISKTNQEVGILDEPGNAEKLASLIEKMMSNAPLRQRISDENRSQARHFSWDEIYGQYRTLYEEVAGKRH